MEDQMDDDYIPIPEPSDDLAPPPRHPPTAAGAATPLLPAPRGQVGTLRRRRGLVPLLRQVAALALDAADELVEQTRRVLRLS
jgi:hypothetical protein